MKTINIGITGARNFKNIDALKSTIEKFKADNKDVLFELHHGDCVGADEMAHNVARDLNMRIVVHPPNKRSMRAFCKGDETMTEKDFIKRNHAIVDKCDVLLAFPETLKEVQRSGTWATIRYAIKNRKEVIYTPNYNSQAV